MPQCAVAGCNNTHRKTKGWSVRYHRFPADEDTRARWIAACGRHVQNCATARICSKHFTKGCYERDVQHELLGLPTRSRLRKGAAPNSHLPAATRKSPKQQQPKEESRDDDVDSAIAVLLAVGLVPNAQHCGRTNGGLPQDLNKMHVMEDVREGCDTQQPSSPGHADQRTDINESTAQSDDDSKLPKEIKSEEDEPTSKSNPSTPRPESSPKRKHQSDGETPTKRSRGSGDIQQEFFLRNKILNEFTGSIDMSNTEQIQTKTEELLTEIRNLTELAKEKEREWDEIIHLKKFKEEMLMKLQRRKQVCLLSNGLEISESEHNGDQKFSMQRKREFNRHKLMKSIQNSLEMNGHDVKNKQRPVRDVQSIIADYRQQHPETVPRRGRRIRSMNGQNNISSSKGVLNFSSMALGSGSQVRQNLNTAGFDVNSDLGLILSAMESASNDLAAPSSTEPHETTSFKDILVQFAKLSQSDKQELLQNTMKAPPPYPEVTVHPVSTTTPPTNSLLHGILTKTPVKTENKSAFSPTLARLLTAPERSVASQQQNQSVNNHKTNAANASISDKLTTNKARNEITITPLGPETETGSPKRKANNATDEEEAEDSVDRLVIDESGEIIDARGDNNSDAGDEVPQCQGCNQKAAQFVCAGCGNQWYCSRECQVTAWDEHSDVCSG